MKFFSATLVVALFCAVAVSAAPSQSPFTSELSLIDESTFGLTDAVTKVLNALIEKTKCTLDVIQDLVGNDDMGNVFKKFRSDVETVLKVDVKGCFQAKGLTAKFKCSLAVTKKLNSLYFNFIKTVLKTNKDLAVKITKALYQCAKKPAPSFISSEEDLAIAPFDSELTFGLGDIIGNIYDALIKKTKCTLDAIEDIVGEGKLRNVFKQLRKEVESILEKDVKQCAATSGLINKLKCVLTIQQKINSLYAKFVNEVTKANKENAKAITKAIFQCLKPSKPQPPKTTTTEKPKTTTTTTAKPLPPDTTTTTTQKPTTTTRKPTTTTRKPTKSTTQKPQRTTTESPIMDAAFVSYDNEIMTFGLTDVVTKILNSLIEKTKCTLDVIQDVIGNDELGKVFKKFRADVESIIKNDVMECVRADGVTAKLKCTVSVTKKINSLYYNFIKTVLKTNKDLAVAITKALVKCAKKSAPFIANEEASIAPFDNEIAYGFADLMNALIEKTKCTLDAIENLLEEGQLKNVYKKLRADVETILKEDVKQCVQTKGPVEQLKCALTVVQKLNTLFANFTKEVSKANKDVAGKIYEAIVKCAKKTQ